MGLLNCLEEPGFLLAAKTMLQLASRPPQVLLLEGGGERERLEMAFYWAMCFNCANTPSPAKNSPAVEPCLNCNTCRQIANCENMDVLVYDGRISNRQDEESPGLVRALNMDNMRGLKSKLAAKPHGEGKRIVVFQGMSSMREEALNSLLKTLEEPCAHTLFVLLAPQRQQILPTLVSRSFCFTLPWRDCLAKESALQEWEELLAAFLGGNPEFLGRIAPKGAMDAVMASGLLMTFQRALTRIMAGMKPESSLDTVLEPMAHNAATCALMAPWINEALEMLTSGVNPVHVLDALACKIFTILRTNGT